MKKKKVVEVILPHWFFNDLYFANIYYFPGTENRHVCQFLKSQFGVEYERELSGDGRCIEVENAEGLWGLIIHTRTNEKDPASMASLAHECLHAANNILRRVGVKIDIGENDEAQTYLMSWIFRKCLEQP